MGSGGLTFKNETTLNYQAKSISIFIQTDKAMYKPGQTGNVKLYLHASEREIQMYKQYGGIMLNTCCKEILVNVNVTD